jgi:trk system potassium uptake protein TrkH
LTHYRALAYVLGQFLLALAGTMLVPLGFALWESGDGLRPLAYGVAATLIAGGLMVALFRRHARQLSRREGVLLVVGTWVSVCFFGSLPFLFSSYFSGLTDAFFESVSGFTTTGATVLDQVEILPRPLQFWRCFTHWLGGMGIVLLGVAILPLLGHGGMELYRAEFSGAKSEKLKPRIAESARSLWKIYFALSVVEFAALRWAGMNSFEALCHTFSTLGTGGFSTRTASIAGFNSPAIEFIILVFMLLAGMSFVQHYRLWVERRPRSILSDVETRNYFVLFVTASIMICLVLVGSSGYAPAEALRSSFFQVGSILTTTGFVTDDFEAWLPLPQLTLLALMFVGGCTGSTAGGLKICHPGVDHPEPSEPYLSRFADQRRLVLSVDIGRGRRSNVDCGRRRIDVQHRAWPRRRRPARELRPPPRSSEVGPHSVHDRWTAGVLHRPRHLHTRLLAEVSRPDISEMVPSRTADGTAREQARADLGFWLRTAAVAGPSETHFRVRYGDYRGASKLVVRTGEGPRSTIAG